MSAETNIEWCDSTFNPWIGCTKVSPACDHCYAECSTPARTRKIAWGPHAERVRTSGKNWGLPERWNREADAFQAQHGRRRRVFCASLADVFDNQVPNGWREELFELIRATPHLDWLLLTKRIGNVDNMLPVPFGFDRLYPNVWIGATVCNQAEVDRDVPKLLRVDARVRFLSVEPMLGPISFEGLFADSRFANDGTNALEALSWVICGGESRPHARPMHPAWAASLRSQCKAAGIPFLFKQWGEWAPEKEMAKVLPGRDVDRVFVRLDGTTHSWADHEPYQASDEPMVRVGKQLAGRLLDGRLCDGYPS